MSFTVPVTVFPPAEKASIKMCFMQPASEYGFKLAHLKSGVLTVQGSRAGLATSLS
jgi:hypothetical protein